MKQTIPLFKVYMSPTAKDEVAKVLESGYIGQGPKVDEFEAKLKERFKTDYVLTTNSATSAEHLAIHMLKKPFKEWKGINDGDEVLSTPLTCLYGSSQILLPNGRTMNINKIVNKKYDGYVMSYNIEKNVLESKKIINWYKSPLGDRKFIRLNHKKSINKNTKINGKSGVWVTDDHPILTTNGYIKSNYLNDNTNIITKHRKLNYSDERILIGMMLGDGYMRISKTRRKASTARYGQNHSYVQEEYGDFKEKLLKDFNCSKSYKPPYKQSKASYVWLTTFSPYLYDIYDRFYINGKKTLPIDFNENDLSEFGLSIWFMDDGSYYDKAGTSILCSDSFTYEENIKLKNILHNKFNINTTVQRCRNHYRLYINRLETKKLMQIIGKYIVPCMRYKIPKIEEELYKFDYDLWDIGDTDPYIDTLEIIKNQTPNTSKSHLQSVYCVDVEDNHNFISGNLILHNCTASNFPTLLNNLKIKWVDVDPTNFNMDLDDLARKITPLTKAIMLAHWGGYPNDLAKVKQIQKKAYESMGIKPVVIEDCAHAFGSNLDGQPIGSHGNICTFSFQAIKHLTSVDGGALVLPHQNLYDRGKLLRWYGIDRVNNKRDFRCESDISEVGYKFHMNDVNAVIGMENLKEVDENVIKIHKDNGKFYDENLKDIPGVTLPQRDPRMDSSYWIYSILVDRKQNFMDYMKECGIMVSQVHERNDIHSALQEYKALLPNLDKITPRLISIPVGWWVTNEQREYIVDCIKKGW